MGMNTALKNGQILDNAYGVLGIEFMAAAQALDFREFKPGKGTQKAREVIRKYGFSSRQPLGNFSFKTLGSVSEGTITQSSPCFQSTGVATE